MLKKGSKGDDVMKLQAQLQQLGYDVEPDGHFGPITDWAVKNFQAMFGYSVDGIVGKGTQGLVDQQIGYSWNAKAENAQKQALGSQGLGS